MQLVAAQLETRLSRARTRASGPPSSPCATSAPRSPASCSWPSSAPASPSCSSPAPTSRASSSPAPSSGARRSRCGRRSGPAATGSCASSSPRPRCWRSPEGPSGVFLAVSALPLVVKLVPQLAADRGGASPGRPRPRVRRPHDRRDRARASASPRRSAGCAMPTRRGCARARGRAREGTRSGCAPGSWWPRSPCPIVLLVSAGLLLRALARLQDVDPGFRTEGVLTARTWLPIPAYELDGAPRPVLRERARGRAVAARRHGGGLHQLPAHGHARRDLVDPDGEARIAAQHTASLRFVTPGSSTSWASPSGEAAT